MHVPPAGITDSDRHVLSPAHRFDVCARVVELTVHSMHALPGVIRQIGRTGPRGHKCVIKEASCD